MKGIFSIFESQDKQSEQSIVPAEKTEPIVKKKVQFSSKVSVHKQLAPTRFKK